MTQPVRILRVRGQTLKMPGLQRMLRLFYDHSGLVPPDVKLDLGSSHSHRSLHQSDEIVSRRGALELLQFAARLLR